MQTGSPGVSVEVAGLCNFVSASREGCFVAVCAPLEVLESSPAGFSAEECYLITKNHVSA